MKFPRLLLSMTVALALGCTNSIGDSPVRGEPISGDVNGSYGSMSFVPKYGVAIPASAPEQGELEVQLAAAAINCESYIRAGYGNPAGIFARIYLKSAELGSYPGTYVEFDELTDSHTSQRLSSAATVDVIAIDDTHVQGSVTFQDTVNDVALSLNGGFDVKRCR